MQTISVGMQYLRRIVLHAILFIVQSVVVLFVHALFYIAFARRILIPNPFSHMHNLISLPHALLCATLFRMHCMSRVWVGHYDPKSSSTAPTLAIQLFTLVGHPTNRPPKCTRGPIGWSWASTSQIGPVGPSRCTYYMNLASLRKSFGSALRDFRHCRI